MNNKISIRKMMSACNRLKEQGERFSLLGIGPMSKKLLTSTFELAKEKDFPIMLIASRNQVDSDEFGGGYVCGWDQDRFVADVKKAAAAADFDGLVYLCRDHGGPWQRDEERQARLPVDKAMDICKRSYLHDIQSGFDLLHIDPTKDPFADGTVPLDLVLDRTAELIDYLEQKRKELNLPEIGYEAGTEETNGGLTSVDAFGEFVNKLISKMASKILNPPEFVVGQTGTLTRLTENVGHFNAQAAATLSERAAKYNVGLKEHNGDYLSDAILLEHPNLNVTAVNVAPEFGVVETRAYLELAQVEKRNIDAKIQSNVSDVITLNAVKSQRWRKWVLKDLTNATVEDILKNEKVAAQVTDICGHYTFDIPEVKQEIAKMYENLSSIGIDGDSYVNNKIKNSIDRYIYCFNLNGLTSKLLRVCDKF